MHDKTILVFGVTGRMGGAAARHLQAAGWDVRGVSRHPESDAAQALQAQSITIVQGDMDDPGSLRAAFEGVYGVFLVVNGWEAGFDGEVRQGKHVADLCAEAGIQHLVFGAAGTGERGTGIVHFDSKLDIEDHIKARGIPYTIVFPPPFMEMMTDPAFFPQVGTWQTKLRILGADYPVPWIASDDIGRLAAAIFAEPDRYIGQRIKPVGEWMTLGECRQLYQTLAGKRPPRWPMPLWLVRRMQPELVQMWEWMRDDVSLKTIDLQPVTTIHPEATDVRTFLQQELARTS